jgi:hypothetical protein
MIKAILVASLLFFSGALSKPLPENVPSFLSKAHRAFQWFSTKGSEDLKAVVTNFILQRDINGLKTVTFNANDLIELEMDLEVLKAESPADRDALNKVVAIY